MLQVRRLRKNFGTRCKLMDPLQALGAEQGRLEKAEEARKAFAASGAKDMEVLEPQPRIFMAGVNQL